MTTKPNAPSRAKACDILGQPVAQEIVPSAWRHHQARLIQLCKQAEMESKGDATRAHLNMLESIERERLESQ